MKNDKYPTEVVFLLAEDIREEVRSKLSLLGVFSGDDIIIRGEKPAIPSLAFFLLIRDGRGTFESSFRINSEEGKNIVDPVKMGKM